ncbi:MAG: hypothetical protein AAF484_06200 [Pseudomonadota bacterium]
MQGGQTFPPDARRTPVLSGGVGFALFVASLLVMLTGGVVAQDNQDEWQAEVVLELPPQGGIEEGRARLRRFAEDPGWTVLAERTKSGTPSSLTLRFPSPFAQLTQPDDTPLRLSVLPTRPAWYIYRFKYLDLDTVDAADFPFRYIEVDWNTEGLPRGPAGSFATAHFDFHFYLKPREFVEREVVCENNGKTCEPMKAGHAQMRRFMALPEPCFLPATYAPDMGSAIPAMGLHLLDGSFDYTLDNVNENAVVIYGTFDGEIMFLETSLTLFALAKAIEAAGQDRALEWSIPQPDAYVTDVWPTRAVLRYHETDNVFAFSYAGFEQRVPVRDCT